MAMRIDPKFMRLASQLSSIVITKAVLLYGAYRLGFWLDQKFHTYPLILFFLIVTVASLGFFWVFKVIDKNRI